MCSKLQSFGDIATILVCTDDHQAMQCLAMAFEVKYWQDTQSVLLVPLRARAANAGYSKTVFWAYDLLPSWSFLVCLKGFV